MSRVAKKPISLPKGVELTVGANDISVKGPKGELSVVVHDDVSVKLVDGKVQLEQRVQSLRAKKLWPTMRTLVPAGRSAPLTVQ